MVSKHLKIKSSTILISLLVKKDISYEGLSNLGFFAQRTCLNIFPIFAKILAKRACLNIFSYLRQNLKVT